ncbi:MAG: SDR family NAD(P)-dependent oxidoreductase [Rhodothermales bacterium]|nr:SDR family NAD(P)-dependent oxidoreductase [Rhodothermales bacterium]
MSRSLAGRVALVTGASSGIGAACARALADAGASLVLVARREDRLADLAASLPVPTLPLELDVRDADAVYAALTTLPDAFAALDIVVNNAGLSRDLDPVYANTVDAVDDMLDTNVKGVVNILRAVVPGMLARGRGHLVQIGSIAGHTVYPGGTVYAASKYAVRALNEGLKMDLHGTPLRVTSIDPGMVETDFSTVRFRGDADRAATVYANTTPLTADDVADVVLFAVTRPPHVNVLDVVMMPTIQSSATMIHRMPVPGQP